VMTPGKLTEPKGEPSLAKPDQVIGSDLFSGLISVTVPSPDW
jgi:hypothetical protein